MPSNTVEEDLWVNAKPNLRAQYGFIYGGYLYRLQQN